MKDEVLNSNNDSSKKIEVKISKPKEKTNLFFKVFFYQVFICLVISFLLFSSKFIFPSFYLDINKKIKNAVSGYNFKVFVDDGIVNLRKLLDNARSTSFSSEKIKKDSEENIAETLEEIEINEQEIEPQEEPEEIKILSAEEEGVLNNDENDDLIFLNFGEPLKGKITSRYGLRKNPLATGEKDFHYGVDILVCDGTPIVAIADGVVEKTASSSKSGNFLSIKHGDIYESLYAHCSKILVPQGHYVKKGDKIALSGHSGNVTGAHLHLGIKKNGNWIDPVEVLPNLL